MKKKFTGHTRLCLGISAAIIVVALIMQICGVGLNLGIDFTGGSILEYSVGEDFDVADVELILASVGYEDAQITKAEPSSASVALQEELAEEAAAAEEEAAEDEEEDTSDEDASEETTEDAAAEETSDEEVTEEDTAEEETSDEEETAEETSEEEDTEDETEDTEEETEDTEEETASLLDPDKSNIESDGLTDLEIRLNLVDEAADMEESTIAAVQALVADATLTEYSQLTYETISNEGYDSTYTGGYILEFDMGGEYDLDTVSESVANALNDAGYAINAINFSAFAIGDEDAEAEEDATEEEAAEDTEEDTSDEDTEETAEEDAEETVEEDTTPKTGMRILIDLDDVTSQVRSVLEEEMSAKYPNFHFISIDHVSAVAGRDLLSNAIKALLLAFVCMLIYIAIRFDAMSGLAALFALLHDVLIMLAFMVFFRAFFQINSSFIAAILTIIGYSINNTIIIFDRIRENVKRPGNEHTRKIEIVEESVSATLSRTVNTTITTLIALVCLYIFGVESIREFAFPLIIGMLAGVYSSVLLSGQVWAIWSEKWDARKSAKKAQKELEGKQASQTSQPDKQTNKTNMNNQSNKTKQTKSAAKRAKARKK